MVPSLRPTLLAVTFSGPASATRLPNGNTLIGDALNSRVVEVDQDDVIVWQYFTNTEYREYRRSEACGRLSSQNGSTLISNQLNNEVLQVNETTDILQSYGLPLSNGTNIGYDLRSTQLGLYNVFNAKVLGDCLGLTATH